MSLPSLLEHNLRAPLTHPRTFSREALLLEENQSRLSVLSAHSPHLFASPLGPFEHKGHPFHLPRFLFVGENSAEEAWRISIFAGLDGRDTRSALAALKGLERYALEPELGDSFNLAFYPLLNPSGVTDGTRRTRSGHLLEEQNWTNSQAPELQLLAREARARQFHGSIVIRSSDEVNELQGWLRGFSPGEPFLHAEPVRGSSKAGYLPFKFPIAWEPHPEGLHAQNGPLTLADDMRMRPFEVTLLVPTEPPLEWAVQAVAHTLRVFLNNFRTAAATGANI